MLNSRKLFLLSTLLFTVISSFAQTSNDTNEGFMRSNDKIYVVVAIVITILIGLILYVVRLDRKITKLEKDK